MKAIIVAVLLISSQAFAGDGGFTNVSCVSASGRTVLSIFNDNFSGSATPSTVRLIIDGQMKEYQSVGEVFDDATEQWVPADPSKPTISWDEEGVQIYEKGKLVLSVAVKLAYADKAINAVIQSGYADPRKGTEYEYYISSNSSISLSCKEYYQGP